MTQVPWAQQWRQFVRFCFAPHLSPRLRSVGTGAGWLRDWKTGVSWQDLLRWAATLWVLNLLLLGPLVISVAHKAGATHLVDPRQLPWLLALVWAPLVEEMLFRYGLRRPAIALWLVPLMVMGLWGGTGWTHSVLFGMAIYLIFRTTNTTVVPAPGARRWLKAYSRNFWWIFHLATVLFAALHIQNFTFSDVQWWMLPILVLPQWVTGLVLGWFRVMHGIGAAILLHALFNLGPMLLVWGAVRILPVPL